MKRFISVALLTVMTATSVFADCTNAYEVKARARAELVKDIKKTGAISGAVVISAATLATLPVVFVFLAGPGWFLIPPIAFAGVEGTNAFLDVKDGIRANNYNNYYKALASITAAKGGSLPKVLIQDLNKKLNLESLSEEDQANALKNAISIINQGNQNQLFCQRKENGKYKIFTYKKMVNHIAEELKI
jgi:hypothetical protein